MPGRLTSIANKEPKKAGADSHSLPLNQVWGQSLNRFQSSLTFIMISIMVILAITPVILVSAGNYIRSRAFIQEQTTWQLQNLSPNPIRSINQYR